jgi:predicted TIM-barrel fold metal-dependent hydrolase
MKKKNKNCTRREFIKRNTLAGLGTVFSLGAASSLFTGCSREEDGETQQSDEIAAGDADPIIDIHQHTNYHGRSYEELLAHQRAMGITTTILLPAGRSVQTASTHGGASNGLGGVQAGGNESCYEFALKYPDEFLFAANEVPDIPEAIEEIEKYLKLGGQMIGESKFGVDCDSPEMQKIYELAGEYDAPVLMHWQYEDTILDLSVSTRCWRSIRM